MEKVYNRSDLEDAFRDSEELYGIPHRYVDRWVLIRWEKQGIFRCRRVPHNNHRVFNKKEVEEIVRAFSPDGTGKGYWFFDEA